MTTNNLATQCRTHHCPSELGYVVQTEELTPVATEVSVVHREGLWAETVTHSERSRAGTEGQAEPPHAGDVLCMAS